MNGVIPNRALNRPASFYLILVMCALALIMFTVSTIIVVRGNHSPTPSASIPTCRTILAPPAKGVCP
jgi:hypothetical protein